MMLSPASRDVQALGCHGLDNGLPADESDVLAFELQVSGNDPADGPGPDHRDLHEPPLSVFGYPQAR